MLSNLRYIERVALSGAFSKAMSTSSPSPALSFEIIAKCSVSQSFDYVWSP